MKFVEIRKKAKDLGVKASKVKKPDLIRKIQIAEGNFDCYGSANNTCDQADCCWKDDCLK